MNICYSMSYLRWGSDLCLDIRIYNKYNVYTIHRRIKLCY